MVLDISRHNFNTRNQNESIVLIVWKIKLKTKKNKEKKIKRIKISLGRRDVPWKISDKTWCRSRRSIFSFTIFTVSYSTEFITPNDHTILSINQSRSRSKLNRFNDLGIFYYESILRIIRLLRTRFRILVAFTRRSINLEPSPSPSSLTLVIRDRDLLYRPRTIMHISPSWRNDFYFLSFLFSLLFFFFYWRR